MPILFNVFVILLLIGITVSLFKALYSFVRNEGESGAVVRALTWRVSLAVALLLLLGVAQLAGWIEPHGVRPLDVEITKAKAEMEEERQRKSGYERYRE